MPPNGLELSGRGPLPHMPFQELGSRFSLAFAGASPVRSSEGLGRISPSHQVTADIGLEFRIQQQIDTLPIFLVPYNSLDLREPY